MIVQEALASTRRRLERAGLPEASLDATVLLMHVLDVSRAGLYSGLQDSISEETLAALSLFADRRVKREPLAYVTGHREFFGLRFLTDARALVPRQETETLVEEVLQIVRQDYKGRSPRIADVGTGSGVIAVSLTANRGTIHVYATDSCEEALALATSNVSRHGLEDQVTLLRGDLLEPVGGPVDIVAANLPYIPACRWDSLQPEVRSFEPMTALVSGRDGLDHLRRLLNQVHAMGRRPRWLALEMDPDQTAPIMETIERRFPSSTARTYRDLMGQERGIIARLVG